MLYTESMEMPSPLLVREAPKEKVAKTSFTEQVANRYAKPRIDIGVCLGSSSFSVTAGEKVVLQPARVAIKESSGKVVALGNKAAEIEGREPEGVVVRAPIQKGVVADARLAAKLLSATIAASKHGLLSAPRIALAVPSDLSAVESQTLLATAKSAGASKVHLVDQAMAAAIGAGRDLTVPEGHLVVHLGAGVTQVTVACLAAPVVSRSLRLAGDAMNESIQEHIRRQHNLAVDLRVADAVKRKLGSALAPVSSTEMTVSGRDLTAGKPLERTLNSLEIYEVLKPHLAQIAQEVRWVVATMSTQLLADVSANGVILSGGGANLRQMDRFLAQETRLKVRIPAQPEELVNRGMQKLLSTSSLRKAVFLRSQTNAKAGLTETRRGTGLLGLLLLSSVFAFGVGVAPQLQFGATTSVSHALGSSVTPSAPLAELWGWHEADSEDSAQLNERRRTQLEKENTRLRKLANAPVVLKNKGNTLVADVVARDPRGWMSTLTLNVGEENGIKKGMTVSDGTNLVGQVSRVQKNRCQVKLFTGKKAVVAAKLMGRKASGVVVGHGKHTLEMRYLDPDAGVKSGDWVLTSGHDGIFPAGMRVGKVTSVKQASGQDSLAATLRPAVDVGKLENVLVLRS